MSTSEFTKALLARDELERKIHNLNLQFTLDYPDFDPAIWEMFESLDIEEYEVTDYWVDAKDDGTFKITASARYHHDHEEVRFFYLIIKDDVLISAKTGHGQNLMKDAK